ncbi:MAG TPA: hypothetical protein VGC41_02630 [Kofleriaceae bacterium]
MIETFSVGGVLGAGFRIYFRNFIAFTLIAAIIYIPLMAFQWYGMQHLGSGSGSSAWIERALQMGLNAFVSGTLTFGVVKELQGQRASIGACIVTGFSRLVPVAVVAFLVLICEMIVPAIAVGMGIAMQSVGGVLFLMLLSFIPAIIIACMLYVATPAAVLEKPGVFGALRRSRELTQGYKGAIFGVLFLLGLFAFGIGLILATALDVTKSLHNMQTFIYVTMGINVVFGAIGACVQAVAYYTLRVEKEGANVNELASVFE